MNRLTLFLTKRYLRTINAEYKSVSKVALTDDLEIEVVIYSSKNDYRLGQATLTRAIIVHEKCFDNEVLLRYVVAHEYGHHKSWFSFLTSLVIIILWPFGSVVILGGLFTLQIDSIILGFVMLFIGCVLSWIIEYKAESTAITILGINQAISARELMGNMPKLPLVWRIISRLTHPPFPWTLSIYKLFHENIGRS